MIDNSLVISDEKELTSTGAVSQTLDLGLEGYAKGDPVHLKCIVTEAFTSAGSATLAVTVASSASESGTYVTHHSLSAVAVADLTLGETLVDIVLPANTDRWIKITYTVGTAAMTAGHVSTYLNVA